MSSTILKTSLLCSFLTLTSVGCTTTQKPFKASNTPQQTVDINLVSAQGIGKKIGTITLQDTMKGLSVSSHLTELPSGFHGFHIHEKGSCQPAEKDGKMSAAIAAGSHFNPHKTGHGTPNEGHMGDLPVLNVDSNGNANTTVIAPRLKLADVQGLAIMIHAGGDNYSDHPKPLGGGGDRIACGVIH